MLTRTIWVSCFPLCGTSCHGFCNRSCSFDCSVINDKPRYPQLLPIQLVYHESFSGFNVQLYRDTALVLFTKKLQHISIPILIKLVPRNAHTPGNLYPDCKNACHTFLAPPLLTTLARGAAGQ